MEHFYDFQTLWSVYKNKSLANFSPKMEKLVSCETSWIYYKVCNDFFHSSLIFDFPEFVMIDINIRENDSISIWLLLECCMQIV